MNIIDVQMRNALTTSKTMNMFKQYNMLRHGNTIKRSHACETANNKSE